MSTNDEFQDLTLLDSVLREQGLEHLLKKIAYVPQMPILDGIEKEFITESVKGVKVLRLVSTPDYVIEEDMRRRKLKLMTNKNET